MNILILSHNCNLIAFYLSLSEGRHVVMRKSARRFDFLIDMQTCPEQKLWANNRTMIVRESGRTKGDFPLRDRLINWGQVKLICVIKLTIIVSDNGLSLGRCRSVIHTNDGLLSNGTMATIFSGILSEIYIFSFKQINLKMSFAKWRQFGLDLNELNDSYKTWMNPWQNTYFTYDI